MEKQLSLMKQEEQTLAIANEPENQLKDNWRLKYGVRLWALLAKVFKFKKEWQNSRHQANDFQKPLFLGHEQELLIRSRKSEVSGGATRIQVFQTEGRTNSSVKTIGRLKQPASALSAGQQHQRRECEAKTAWNLPGQVRRRDQVQVAGDKLSVAHQSDLEKSKTLIIRSKSKI